MFGLGQDDTLCNTLQGMLINSAKAPTSKNFVEYKLLQPQCFFLSLWLLIELKQHERSRCPIVNYILMPLHVSQLVANNENSNQS